MFPRWKFVMQLMWHSLSEMCLTLGRKYDYGRSIQGGPSALNCINMYFTAAVRVHLHINITLARAQNASSSRARDKHVHVAISSHKCDVSIGRTQSQYCVGRVKLGCVWPGACVRRACVESILQFMHVEWRLSACQIEFMVLWIWIQCSNCESWDNNGLISLIAPVPADYQSWAICDAISGWMLFRSVELEFV